MAPQTPATEAQPSLPRFRRSSASVAAGVGLLPQRFSPWWAGWQPGTLRSPESVRSASVRREAPQTAGDDSNGGVPPAQGDPGRVGGGGSGAGSPGTPACSRLTGH